MRPDDKGEFGENYFAGLCNKAGIDQERSHWDKTGWDFRIELRDECGDHESREKRHKRSFFLVQVKTTSKNAKNVKIRLSMLEKLAKDSSPSLVVVVVMDGSKVDHLVIVPILSDALSFVLSALRECDLKCPADFRHKTVSFPFARLGKAIEDSPSALKDYLETHSREDPFRYAQIKRGQLETLGYCERPFLVNFQVHATTDQMADFFLGKDSIEIQQFVVEEYRFGIPRRIEFIDTPGRLNISRPYLERVAIVNSRFSHSKAYLGGRLFINNHSRLGQNLLRINSDLVEITVSDDKVKFLCREDFKGKVVSLLTIIETMKTLEMFHMGKTNVRIKNELGRNYEIFGENDENTAALKEVQEIRKCYGALLDIIRDANFADIVVSQQSIHTSWDAINNLHTMIVDREPAIINIPKIVPSSEQIEMPLEGTFPVLIIDYIRFDNNIICFSMKGTGCFSTNEEYMSFYSNNCYLRSLDIIDNDSYLYEVYSNEAKAGCLDGLTIINLMPENMDNPNSGKSPQIS